MRPFSATPTAANVVTFFSLRTRKPGSAKSSTSRLRAVPSGRPRRATLSIALLGILLTSAFAAVAPIYGATNLLSPEARRDLELQPGVVLIVVSFKARLGSFSCEPAAMGSGFLYRPDGYLITNGHVAQWANGKDQQADNARMKQAIPCLADKVVQNVVAKQGHPLTDPEKEEITKILQDAIASGKVHISDISLTVMLDNQAKYPGEIKAYSDPINEGGKDIAIVKIDGKNLPTTELGNSDEMRVGDGITVVGYPGAATNATIGGLFSRESIWVPTVTTGRISAVNKTDYHGTPVLQSEAVINHGNSGGPAFDSNGRVIGIATYALANDAAGLNFFVPINTAMEFVRTAGAAPERGAFDAVWRDGLQAYAGQNWAEAHDKLSNALEMLPGQPDALKLQSQAATNLSQMNPLMRVVQRLGMTTLLIATGAVLGLIVILFIVLKMSLKPKGPAPIPAPRTGMPQPVSTAPLSQTVVAKPAAAPRDSYGTLQVLNGPLAGNRFLIPKNGLLIGRDPSRCAVVLSGDSVSKEHAWVVPLDNGVAVIDRDSTNGTYVNSTSSPRINKVVLNNGDRIFVGAKSPTEITYFAS